MNNPKVPSLIYKLAPLDEKMPKLHSVRKLGEGVLEMHSVDDIFTRDPLEATKYDVDHYIPWSFVMNDELWNLMPMDSSKSNPLPEWVPFFKLFARNQFLMYQLVQESPKLRRLYESCQRNNLHSLWPGQE